MPVHDTYVRHIDCPHLKAEATACRIQRGPGAHHLATLHRLPTLTGAPRLLETVRWASLCSWLFITSSGQATSQPYSITHWALLAKRNSLQAPRQGSQAKAPINTMPGGSSLSLCSLARRDAAGSLGCLPALWSGSTCPRSRDVKASFPSCIFTLTPSDRKDEEERDQDHVPAARRREAWTMWDELPRSTVTVPRLAKDTGLSRLAGSPGP